MSRVPPSKRRAAEGGKAADTSTFQAAYLPARLPTDRYFDAASRLEDPTSPYYWTGRLIAASRTQCLPHGHPFCTWAVGRGFSEGKGIARSRR